MDSDLEFLTQWVNAPSEAILRQEFDFISWHIGSFDHHYFHTWFNSQQVSQKVFIWEEGLSEKPKGAFTRMHEL